MKKKNCRTKFNIKLNDTVEIIAGDDKGKQGIVSKIISKKNKIVVDGINICFKHKKPIDTNQSGKILNYEFPIHISNVRKIYPIDAIKSE